MTALAPSVSINTQHPRVDCMPLLADEMRVVANIFAAHHHSTEMINAGADKRFVELRLAKMMLGLDPDKYIMGQDNAQAIHNTIGLLRVRIRNYEAMLAWLEEKGFTLANEFGAEPLVVIKYHDLRGMEFTVKLYME